MSVKILPWAWLFVIKPNQKYVLVALCDQANHEGYCFPSLNYLVKKTGLSRSSLIEHLKSLEEMGIVKKIKRYSSDGYRQTNAYQLNLSLSPESLCPKTLHSNLLSSEKSELNPDVPVTKSKLATAIKEEPPLTIKELSHEVKELFSYWQQKTNHPNAKLDKKRKLKIEQALQLGYDLPALKLAVDGCVQSPWHCGVNPQKKKYNDIELILRDASKIEDFQQMITDKNINNISALSPNAGIFAGAI